MEFLIRLRVLLWLMVLSLWGLMLYQFLGDDAQSAPRMRWISRSLVLSLSQAARGGDAPRIPAKDLFPPRPPDEVLTPPPAPPQTREPIPPIVPSAAERRTLVAPLPAARPPKERALQGFVERETRHFTVYTEGGEAPAQFLETLENLHANLMLDLVAFSPWARDERVSIFLFRNQDSYRAVTGRPAWSGGASSVKRRKIYLFESKEVFSILAHELCHIYFDSFFAQGSPLWLSEGMATLVQTERGLAAPNWLKDNLAILRRGGGYSLGDLTGIETTSGSSDDDVRLWYTQSYSVVRFLLRSRYRSSFYRFCVELRAGLPIGEALRLAYGMPFNSLQALEQAWRYDLITRKSRANLTADEN